MRAIRGNGVIGGNVVDLLAEVIEADGNFGDVVTMTSVVLILILVINLVNLIVMTVVGREY